MNSRKAGGLAAAVLLAGAMMAVPAAQAADAALERAMDRAADNYKRNQGGGVNAGRGDAMKAGQKGDAMKSDKAKGDPMRAGAKGDSMKQGGGRKK